MNEMCKECERDREIVCRRDADVQCLHCDEFLCGGHVVGHLSALHSVATDSELWRGRVAGQGGSLLDMRDRLIEIRDGARARYQGMKRCHGACPEGELWLVLAYLCERILASGLC